MSSSLTKFVLVGLIAPILGLTPESMSSTESATDSRPWFNEKLSPKERAQALIATLSLEDKVHQLITETPRLASQGIPAYHWRNNVLHGLVDNGVSTQFPQATGLAATWDAAMLEAVGSVCGIEQRAKHNIQTNFNESNDSIMDYGLDLWGPNINMLRDSRWGRAQETYGEDPTLTGVLAAKFITGLQTGPVEGIYKTIATAKHFDAYSLDKSPPRLSFDPNISEADLQQYYFPAFTDVVDAGVKSIMCSYNGINGYPMCMSPLIQSELRDKMGFEGYVVTDSGALDFMVSMFKRFTEHWEAAAAAMNAGVDLNSGGVYLDLVQALNNSKVTEAQIDVALMRVFEARIQVGLLNARKSLGEYGMYNESDILSKEHRALALQAGKKSLVLLRNENNLLPLSTKSGMKIAVVGPAANDTFRLMGNYYGCSFGTWGPVLDNCSSVTPLAGLQTYANKNGMTVRYAQGCEQENSNTSGFTAAQQIAEDADIVIAVLGLRNCEGGQGEGGPNCESEGHDRVDLGLPGQQLPLLQMLKKTGKPVVLVTTGGGPLSLPWASQNIEAIVYSWYGGITAGTALAESLFAYDGASPAGRLPFSVVQDAADLPDDLDMSLIAKPYGRTYRYFTGKDLQFTFGYGLSYTKFAYSNVKLNQKSFSVKALSPLEVCFDVKNVGTMQSEEVVQLYASRTSATAGLQHVPKVQLLAFNRTTSVMAGNTLSSCLTANLARLSLVGGGGDFAVQPGTYTLFLGGSPPGNLGVNVDRSVVATPIQTTLTFTA